jgi:hypothetical protein
VNEAIRGAGICNNKKNTVTFFRLVIVGENDVNKKETNEWWMFVRRNKAKERKKNFKGRWWLLLFAGTYL